MHPLTERCARTNAILAREIDSEFRRLVEALRPFAEFAEKADQFVEARAKDNGSPIMPVNDFRLSDFRRVQAAFAANK